MDLYNSTSLATILFFKYTDTIFGNPIITSVLLLLIIFLIAMFARVPLPISLALLLPLSLVMMAIGWLPILAGSIIAITLFVLAGYTLAKNVF